MFCHLEPSEQITLWCHQRTDTRHDHSATRTPLLLVRSRYPASWRCFSTPLAPHEVSLWFWRSRRDGSRDVRIYLVLGQHIPWCCVACFCGTETHYLALRLFSVTHCINIAVRFFCCVAILAQVFVAEVEENLDEGLPLVCGTAHHCRVTPVPVRHPLHRY